MVSTPVIAGAMDVTPLQVGHLEPRRALMEGPGQPTARTPAYTYSAQEIYRRNDRTQNGHTWSLNVIPADMGCIHCRGSARPRRYGPAPGPVRQESRRPSPAGSAGTFCGYGRGGSWLQGHGPGRTGVIRRPMSPMDDVRLQLCLPPNIRAARQGSQGRRTPCPRGAGRSITG